MRQIPLRHHWGTCQMRAEFSRAKRTVFAHKHKWDAHGNTQKCSRMGHTATKWVHAPLRGKAHIDKSWLLPLADAWGGQQWMPDPVSTASPLALLTLLYSEGIQARHCAMWKMQAWVAVPREHFSSGYSHCASHLFPGATQTIPKTATPVSTFLVISAYHCCLIIHSHWSWRYGYRLTKLEEIFIVSNVTHISCHRKLAEAYIEAKYFNILRSVRVRTRSLHESSQCFPSGLHFQKTRAFLTAGGNTKFTVALEDW